MSALSIVRNVREGWWNVMPEAEPRRISGYVLPAGDGAVGKSSLALALKYDQNPAALHGALQLVRKTRNLEFEYISDEFEENGQPWRIMQQYLIPPGQRAAQAGPEERTYERILDIYRDFIRRVDVVLLSYNITDLESYHNLEEWLHLTAPLLHPASAIILVGTHLDLEPLREVTSEQLKQGAAYIHQQAHSLRPEWRGITTGLEVSNLSGQNQAALKRRVSQGFQFASRPGS